MKTTLTNNCWRTPSVEVKQLNSIKIYSSVASLAIKGSGPGSQHVGDWCTATSIIGSNSLAVHHDGFQSIAYWYSTRPHPAKKPTTKQSNCSTLYCHQYQFRWVIDGMSQWKLQEITNHHSMPRIVKLKRANLKPVAISTPNPLIILTLFFEHIVFG